MFDMIISWFVFIMLASVVAVIAAAFGQIIVDTITYHTKANAFIALFGLFGGVFAIFAPVIFSSVIPTNTWGTLLVLCCWFIATPVLLFLSFWAYERN